MNANVIELNGNRYDASTGKLLGPADVRQPVVSQVKVIDGLMKPATRRAANSPSRHATERTTTVKAPEPSPQALPDAYHVPVRTVHHAPKPQPQRSKTLMRTAVHRPDVSFKHRAKAATPTDVLVKAAQLDLIAPKRSAALVDKDRLKRAREIARSRLVSRFGDTAAYAPRSVASWQPAPRQSQAATGHSSAAHTEAASSLPSSNWDTALGASQQPSADIFERALAHADSHRQPHHEIPRGVKKSGRLRRATSVAASALAITLIIGFVAYLNVTTIQLHIASSRSGVNATLPRWHPDGFRVGGLAYHPGMVTISFQSERAPSNFRIVQTASSWDNAALLNNFVYPNNDSYQTIQSAGSTIYTFGNNDATWVNGGVWYRLYTNGSLSTSQIVHLAVSM